MSIQERKNKNGKNSYIVRVRDRYGKWFPTKSFSRKIDAKTYQSQLLSSKSNGTTSQKNQLTKLKLSEYWDVWEKQCRLRVSEGWKLTQDSNFKLHIKPTLGNKQLECIEPIDISMLLDGMNKRGQSEQSQTHIYNLLRKMFADLNEHFGCPLLSPVRKNQKPRIRLKERTYLSQNEIEMLLSQIKGSWLELPVSIGLLCGLRAGEIHALKVSSVDLNNQKLLIQGTYNKKTGKFQSYTKQSTQGSVPIPTSSIPLFKSAMTNKKSDDLLVCGATGDGLKYDGFLKALKQACKEAKVPVVTCHELRHSCAELWARKGASTEELRRLLNHKSVASTSRYLHNSHESLQEIADKL
jgi:integrase